MNPLGLLNVKEKILSLLIKGLSMSQVAAMNECTAIEKNRVRLQIIDKFDKASSDKFDN